MKKSIATGKNIATAVVSVIAIICDIMWSPFYKEGLSMVIMGLLITAIGVLSFRGLLAAISHVWENASPIGAILMTAFAVYWGGTFIYISMMEEYSMMVIGMMFLTPSVMLVSLTLFFPFVAPAFL